MTSFDTTIRARDVSEYLGSKGWQRDGERNGATVWRLGAQARLLVPDVHEYDDADDLIQEAVAKIARYEARPELDVWRDIAEPMMDSQFFRLHPDAPSGSIPLPAGVKAAQGILGLLKSAATVTESGTPLLTEGRRTGRVDAFLHRVLLGSAIPGSYVLTAKVPVDPIGQQELQILGTSREFSGRTVIRQFHTALESAWSAASQVLDEPDQVDAFYAAAEDGVSPGMCRALADLGGEKRDMPFEIGFSWARGLPGEQSVAEIRFAAQMPRIFAAAAEELEALSRNGVAVITGVITDLHDEDNEPSRIKIKGELQAPDKRFPRRSIWVQLNAADYNAAIEAHRRRDQVQAIGRFAATGSLKLRADNFQVLR